MIAIKLSMPMTCDLCCFCRYDATDDITGDQYEECYLMPGYELENDICTRDSRHPQCPLIEVPEDL